MDIAGSKNFQKCKLPFPSSRFRNLWWPLIPEEKYGALSANHNQPINFSPKRKTICFWRGSCCQPKSRFHPCLADRLDLRQLGGSTSWDLGHTELGQLRFHVLTRENKWLGHDGNSYGNGNWDICYDYVDVYGSVKYIVDLPIIYNISIYILYDDEYIWVYSIL